MKRDLGSRKNRGRGNGGGRGNSGGNRHKSLESGGPSVKVRGNASQVLEKYLSLARDAASSSDRVAAENYYQHAEHYYRLLHADQDRHEASQSAKPGNGQAAGEGQKAPQAPQANPAAGET